MVRAAHSQLSPARPPSPPPPTPFLAPRQRLKDGLHYSALGTEVGAVFLVGVPPAATQLGKTPKTAARRRALGDITNATPARGVATEFKASAAKTAARPAAAEPAAAATQHSVAEAQIHAWAEEGVERRAGKSWAVLEAERRRRDEADIAAGVEAMLSFLTRGPLAYGSVGVSC